MFREAGDHNDRTAVERDPYSKTPIIAGRAESICALHASRSWRPCQEDKPTRGVDSRQVLHFVDYLNQPSQHVTAQNLMDYSSPRVCERSTVPPTTHQVLQRLSAYCHPIHPCSCSGLPRRARILQSRGNASARRRLHGLSYARETRNLEVRSTSAFKSLASLAISR